MTTKHYATPEGVYLGGFGDGAIPLRGAIEVTNAPDHASQLWVSGQWQSRTYTQVEQEAKRQKDFAAEADPLFFQWQAGESTEEEWLAKRQEVRDRYPYPTE